MRLRSGMGAAVVVVAVGLVVTGFSVSRLHDVSSAATWQAAPQPAVAVSAPAGSPSPVPPPRPPSARPSHAPSPSHSPTPKPKPKPKPTKKKVTTAPPPKPKPAPVSGCSKPFYVGTNAPSGTVKDALSTAASTQVWTVSQVTLPSALIEAVAWQESGWQSAIRACDGGVGTMQVMPDTATMMNQRFDASWDITTLDGNTMIGSAYLQWLVKYFGDAYFNGDYTLDAADCASDDATIPDYTTPCLLNAVIAAYNYGAGAVGQDTIVIPNPGYVSDVRALMESCPCDNS
jgi:Transglycosylase SLT domain